MKDSDATLEKTAEALGIGSYARHVLLCTGDKCCSPEVGQAAWEVLKRELKDRKLSLSTGDHACYRSKVNCLRVCSNGPILVVYPDGHWYGGMTAEKVPEFVERHLVGDEPIEEWTFARNELSS